MPEAASTSTTNRRRAEQAATIGLMLLKASVAGYTDPDGAMAIPNRAPVLTGGAQAKAEEFA